MPRTTREWAKRKLDEAKNNLEWSGNHLLQVVNVYQAKHPEVSSPLETCMAVISSIQDRINDVKGSF